MLILWKWGKNKMTNKFDDYQLNNLYNKVEELREQVKNNKAYMDYYNQLKEINKNDQLYGWIFNTDDILNDTPEELDLYQNAYIRDILTVYKNELENIILKVIYKIIRGRKYEK